MLGKRTQRDKPLDIVLTDQHTPDFIDKRQQKVFDHLMVFWIPASTTIVGIFSGWFSLKQADLQKNKRHRAIIAFLYYDGAHGLYPQMLAALLFLTPMSELISTAFDYAFPTNELNIFFLYAAIFVLLYLSFHRVAFDLFEFNGYEAYPLESAATRCGGST